jgi:o-succinylbenzoate synthase
VIGRDARDLDALLDEAEGIASHAPAARAALDAALFDLAARAADRSVAALIAAPQAVRERVRVSALLRGSTPSEIAGEAQSAVREGFQTLKLKVGARDLVLEEARVAAIREVVGADVKLRIDANGAWKEAEAEQALARFAPHAIEFCEQPVEASDIAGLARLRAVSPIAIAADEALASGRALGEILERGAADLLVLKPAALGGLRACVRVAASARATGVGCVVTSAFDSALGLTAALQLAAALPGPLPDAGLATGGAFVEDLGPAPLPTRGEIVLPEPNGMGVAPLPAALARCAVESATEIVG